MNMTQNKNIYNKILQVSNETLPNGTHLKYFQREEDISNNTTNHTQLYNGEFFNNTLHGTGTYIWKIDREKYVYEGKFYKNALDGYGRFSYPDGKVFEGLFKRNSRFGPGVQIYSDGTQDVGLWKGFNLIRVTRVSSSEIPNLADTVRGQSYILQHKTLVPIDENTKERLDIELDKLDLSEDYKEIIGMLYEASLKNAKGVLFNKRLYDDKYYETNPDYCIKLKESLRRYSTKRFIFASDLLAWNNDPMYLILMKHAFLNRKMERMISFSVSEILCGQSPMFRAPGEHEQRCNSFFKACRCDKNIEEFFLKDKFHPNLSDRYGNSGVIYATVFNNVRTIRNLLNFGANINHQNDETLTPLLISLLCYITLQHDVQNWEKAFIPPKFSTDFEESIQQWRSLNLSKPEVVYTQVQAYIFDLSCNRSQQLQQSQKKKKDVKKEKPVEVPDKKQTEVGEPKGKYLDVILRTIVSLLCFGANANFGDMPFPPIFLSLFTHKPAILGHLIKFGADYNCVLDSPEKLTPLHVLCSMKPVEELVEMAEILLKNGADANKRAGGGHWVEEKLDLTREFEVEDLGKSPLHLLSMRWDHSADEKDVFGKIFMMFCRYGAEFHAFYLGHTPLSLACLRGNVKLINNMLNSRKVNVNQELENGMGFAFTVLGLKRYACILPYALGKSVIDTLISHHANPFLMVSSFDKTSYEFINDDNNSNDAKKKEKGSKKEKVKKDHVKLLTYFKTCTATTLLRHIQGRVVKFLYINKFKNKLHHHLYEIVVNFLNINDVLIILQNLITYRGIRPEEKLCLALIEYVLQYTKPAKAKKQPKKPITPEDYLKKLDLEKRRYTFFEATPPEIDQPEKYRVCFQCYEKTNKFLVPCPECKLIYFCSVKCNDLNIKKKDTKHPCKIKFYADEQERIQRLLETGQYYEDGFHDILPVKVSKRKSFDFFHKEFNFSSDDSPEMDESTTDEDSKDNQTIKGKKELDENKKRGKKRGASAESFKLEDKSSKTKLKKEDGGKKAKIQFNEELKRKTGFAPTEKSKKDLANEKKKQKILFDGSNEDVQKKKSGKKFTSTSKLSKDIPLKSRKRKMLMSSTDMLIKNIKEKLSKSESHSKFAKDVSLKASKETLGTPSKKVLSKSPKSGVSKASKEGVSKSSKEGVSKSSREGVLKSSREGVLKSSKKDVSKSSKGVSKPSREGVLKSPKGALSKSQKAALLKSSKEKKSPKKSQEEKHPRLPKGKSYFKKVSFKPEKGNRREEYSQKATHPATKQDYDKKKLSGIKKQLDKQIPRSSSVDRRSKTQDRRSAGPDFVRSKFGSGMRDRTCRLKDKMSEVDLERMTKQFKPGDFEKFRERLLCYCVLVDGQLYYKFNTDDIFCKMNYSYV